MSFWADKNKADIEKLVEAHRVLASRLNIMDDRIKAFDDTVIALQQSCGKLAGSLDAKAVEDTRVRLEKLELWRGELHRMLVEPNPGTGRPKLTKSGRFLRTAFGK